MNQRYSASPKKLDRFTKWVIPHLKPVDLDIHGGRVSTFKMHWTPFPKSVFNADSEKISSNLPACNKTSKSQFYGRNNFFRIFRPSRHFKFFSVKKELLKVKKVIFVISSTRRIRICMINWKIKSTRILH